MTRLDIQLKGLEQFRAAIKKNPSVVRSAASQLITRGMAAYRRVIMRNPWQVGSSGGGAPKDTGNLRGTHIRNVNIAQLHASIRPTAPYADYVHEGTGRMGARPWLDYAQETADPEIRKLSDDFLRKVTNNLAS